MNYVSGWSVWGIHTWLGWSGEVAEPIGSIVPGPHTLHSLTYFIHLPMKMEPTVSSETSAIRTQTLGNYPKRITLHLEHGESLKTRLYILIFIFLDTKLEHKIFCTE